MSRGEHMGPAGAEDGQGPRHGNWGPEAMLKRKDADGNGILTVEEFVNTSGQGKGFATEEIFERLDANGDKQLTIEEIKAHMQQRHRGRAPHPRGN